MPSSSSSALEQVKKALKSLFRRNKEHESTRQKIQQIQPGLLQDTPATEPAVGDTTWSGRTSKNAALAGQEKAPTPPPKPTLAQMADGKRGKSTSASISPESEKEAVFIPDSSLIPVPPVPPVPAPAAARDPMAGGPINAVRDKFQRPPPQQVQPQQAQSRAWEPVSSNGVAPRVATQPQTFQAELPGSEGTKLEAELKAMEGKQEDATPVDSANTPSAGQNFDEYKTNGEEPPAQATNAPTGAMQATSGPLQDWYSGH